MQGRHQRAMFRQRLRNPSLLEQGVMPIELHDPTQVGHKLQSPPVAFDFQQAFKKDVVIDMVCHQESKR